MPVAETQSRFALGKKFGAVMEVKMNLKTSLAVMALVALTNSVSAQETLKESLDTTPDNLLGVPSGFSAGVQAAPLTFGLSVKYAYSELWGFQGVITPVSSDPGLALRAMRTLGESTYWMSYAFGGFATGPTDLTEDFGQTIVLSTGLGVELGWQFDNNTLPPLFFSFDFGLGYVSEGYDGTDPDYRSDEGLILNLGAGVHYKF